MKKRKANHTDIPTYYKFARRTKSETTSGISGWYYWLSEELNEDVENDLLSKYNNIIFYKSSMEYAPELNYRDVIFIADKVLFT